MVNTSQQVGGAVGTALLSTLVVSATTSFAEGKARTPPLDGRGGGARLHVAFWVSAGIFALAAVITGVAAALRPAAVHAARRAQEPAREAAEREAELCQWRVSPTLGPHGLWFHGRVSTRAWTSFAAVSVLWGIPYLFIKVAVEDGVPPAFLAWARVLLAALVLCALAWHRGPVRLAERALALGRVLRGGRDLDPVPADRRR